MTLADIPNFDCMGIYARFWCGGERRVRAAVGQAIMGLCASALLMAGQAAAKEITVKVDSHSGPWNTGVNRSRGYGIGAHRAPTVVWNVTLLPGTKIKFSATGSTTTVDGGGSYDANGQQDWVQDHGAALFPSHYIASRKKPIHLNELIGCFIDADGAIVGQPFAIGTAAEISVPEGSSAISLGINDDNYSDNLGFLMVTVTVPEAQVIVGSTDAK